ncbi:U3 small nucleolar RNA-associated protein 25 homolog [Uranotaenia lowii]|uniref:U3 small nucleolar RNA-associated protein 25 homolog n=1 Tax=Uranotaenia lowii TaxID=190385 RepID=UPI00247A9BDF|nr:U3 small nucleolar RNA-associated protein 25 homolog [Uranotaenia lowii]
MANKQHHHKGGKGGRNKGGARFLSAGMKKQRRKDRSQKAPVSRFRKNLKHIERAQEAREALKRQQDAERRYKHKMNGPGGNGAIDDADQGLSSEASEAEDDFETLVKTMTSNRKGGTKREEAIESDESEEEEEDDDDEDEDEEELEGDELINDESNQKADSEEDQQMEEDSDKASDEDQRSEDELNVSDEDEKLLEEEMELDSSEQDPFMVHLNNNISPQMLEALSAKPPIIQKSSAKFKKLGQLVIEIPKDGSKTSQKSTLLGDEETFASEGTIPESIDADKFDLNKVRLKEKLLKRLDGKTLNQLQVDCYTVLNNYQDLYYPERSLTNGEDLRFVYSLHALNHIVKSTTKILHHNLKLAEATSKKKQKKKTKKAISSVLEYRDQGLVRPKVLIVVPFRSAALKIVENMKQIFAGDNPKVVTNWKRFESEYGGETLYFPKHNPKPEEYEKIFAGNTDDNFRIGISFGKSSMKLYTKYYNSDLILASPLGLRMTIGAEGEAHRDYDFLASIEMLILDQAEICMSQNWDHVIHLMDHLHLQPQSTEHTDFSRVRYWCLNGWSRFYRQTILLSSTDLPEFRSIFNNKCANYRGKIRSANPIKTGTIRHVVVQVPQTFHRIEVTSLEQSFDAKFHHFTTVLLPQLRSVTMARTLVFIPSYFDYVRLRNYFKKEELNFVQICEYTKDAKIARARDMFFHGSSHFMLYSERSHFFRRPRIKGVRHLVFYQLPAHPQFYSEMINLMAAEYQNKKDGIDASTMTVTVLWTKYDVLRLSAIIGSEQAAKIAGSVKAAHTFTTQK